MLAKCYYLLRLVILEKLLRAESTKMVTLSENVLMAERKGNEAREIGFLSKLLSIIHCIFKYLYLHFKKGSSNSYFFMDVKEVTHGWDQLCLPAKS